MRKEKKSKRMEQLDKFSKDKPETQAAANTGEGFGTLGVGLA